MTQDIGAALGMTQPMGSIVSDLHADGPAVAAGLQVGDVILRYDNHTLYFAILILINRTVEQYINKLMVGYSKWVIYHKAF